MGYVTIKTLAKELNLSTAAISKALRNSHEISSITKQRVQELATRLNYTPNVYAGSLRGRKSKTIAVVLPEVADSFFSLAINGIEAIAEANGYHVLIYLTHENFSREQAILKDFQSGRVDGVLMSLTAETSSYLHINELYSKQIPLVFFDRVCEEISTAKITTDDFNSAYIATKHLIDCGCRQIALLSISNYLSISNMRLEGYRQALTDYPIQENPVNIFCGNDAAANRRFIRHVLSKADRPDGIVATAEKLTSDVYLSCRELALSIPDDLKIVSFSNLHAAAILNPSLTTITQPAFDMGKAAASILFKALDKKNNILRNENITMPSELMVRGSTVKDA